MSFLFRSTFAVMASGAFLSAPIAYAKDNPFIQVCKLSENVDRIGNSSNSCPTGIIGTLSYSKQFNNDDAGNLLNALIESLGQPEALRIDSHVWRVDNPSKNKFQKDTVTIVLTLPDNGPAKLMMDRVRPGTVFATGIKSKRNESDREKRPRPEKPNVKRTPKPKSVF